MNPVTYLDQLRVIGYGLIVLGIVFLVLLLVLVARIGSNDRHR